VIALVIPDPRAEAVVGEGMRIFRIRVEEQTTITPADPGTAVVIAIAEAMAAGIKAET
jgi:hypothetical protein